MKNLRREIKNCLPKRLLPFGFVPKGKYARFVRIKANTVQIIALGFSNGSRNVTADMNDYLAFARNFKKFIEAGHYKRKALSY